MATNKQIEAGLLAWKSAERAGLTDRDVIISSVLDAVDEAAWEPIETAPHTHTPILVTGGTLEWDTEGESKAFPITSAHEACWQHDHWSLGYDDDGIECIASPMFWRPMPAARSAASRRGT